MTRLLALAVGSAVALCASASHAQQIPLGEAQGGRSGGAESPVGGAGEAPSFEFPPEAHGLPVPLGLAESGVSSVDEAGLGWSMPTSYVEVNPGFSRRRPRFVAAYGDPTPSAMPSVKVSLGGKTTTMVAVDGQGHYRAVVDGQAMTLTDLTASSGTWQLLDGHGRQYRFAGIGDANRWYLTRIIDGTGAHVDLAYQVDPIGETLVDPHGSGVLGTQVRLMHVDYDFGASGCAKHTIGLEWGNPLSTTTALLGFDVGAGVVRARTQVVTGISVWAQGTACGTAKRIAHYVFRYAADLDKPSLPRLAKIDVFGRDGSTEASQALPVVRYRYGSSTQNNPTADGVALDYAASSRIALPSGAGLGVFGDFTLPFLGFTVGVTGSTVQDWDGDGLPDLVSNSQWWRNHRGSSFDPVANPFPGLSTSAPPLGIHTTYTQRYLMSYGVEQTAHEDVHAQLIDFNRDGRTDVLTSSDDASQIGFWTLYLNDPAGWRAIQLDVSDVMASLQKAGHRFVSPSNGQVNLPLMRSTTGQDYQQMQCTGSTSCPAEQYVVLEAPQVTRVDWKLQDVNGDGYPDLVASMLPSENFQIPCPPSGGDVYGDMLGSGYTAQCTLAMSFRFAALAASGGSEYTPQASTQVAVFYNRMGVELGEYGQGVDGFPALKPFAASRNVEGSTACGIEEWRSLASNGPVGASSYYEEGGVRYLGWLPTRGSQQRCGLLDLNGDGLADRVEHADSMSGQTWQPGQGRVALGIGAAPASGGDAFVGNFASEWGLEDAAATLAVVENGNWNTCKIVPQTATTYHVKLVSGFLDLDGDGIADYFHSTCLGATCSKYAALGTGVGLSATVPLAHMPNGFAASDALESCDGSPSATTGGLYDVDGDGRPDLVQLDTYPNPTALQTWSLQNATGPGDLDAGRLTEVRNGYGATMYFHYASAKQHYAPTQTGPDTTHQVPFPEIVVDRRWTVDTTAGTTPIGLTSIAYGGARLWFDGLSDRWTFRGYERVASVTGANVSPDAGGAPSGKVVDAYQPEDLGPGYPQNLMYGRTKREMDFVGYLPSDPRAWLDPNVPLTSSWFGQVDLVYDQVFQSLDAAGSSSDLWDCTYAPQPRQEHEQTWMSYGFSQNGDYDLRCRYTSAVYPKVVLRRRGDAAPPSTGLIESQTKIAAVDALGRPTMIEHDGDLHDGTDDSCEVRKYATPNATWGVADAVSEIHWMAAGAGAAAGGCSSPGVTLAGERFLYDGFTPGVVNAGVYTGKVVERYDPQGTKLEEFLSEALYFVSGHPGVLDHAVVDSGGGNGAVLQHTVWDPWYLQPTTRAVSSIPNASVALTTVTDYDPYTLVVNQATDPNGQVVRTAYDGYGRPTGSTFIDPATKIENQLSGTVYAGATTVSSAGPFADATGPLGDTLASSGRSVTVRSFHELVAAGTTGSPLPGETDVTAKLDALGRVRLATAPLGADYGGQTLVVADRTYDTMGRLTFAADPYVSGEATPHYGTSVRYRGDGAALCTERGRGPQTTWSTSPSDARYLSCAFESFNGYVRFVRSTGPEENDPQSTAYGAYDLDTTTAIGRPTLRQRVAPSGTGTAVTSQIAFAYDGLGHLRQVGRWSNPSAGTGAAFWTTTTDSLGLPLTQQEPGAAVRTLVHDHGGHLVEVDWLDGSTKHAIKSQYDGLGRVTRASTFASDASGNMVEDAPSVAQYFYDTGSGEPFHQGTAYALGRMTYAVTPAQSVYLGYDSLGQTSFTAWVDALGQRVEQSVQHRADGSARQIVFGMPDNGYAPETATYEYDSAQRPSKVHWTDEAHATSIDLLSAAQRDARGRLRAATYGNGVKETFTYRDADRNELTGATLGALGLCGSGGCQSTTSYAFDDAMRPKARTDTTTFGGTRSESTAYSYDASERLAATTVRSLVDNSTVLDEKYAYDALGNMTSLVDAVGSRGFTAVADSVDPDRLCSVSASDLSQPPGCSFQYDALGNVVRSPLAPNNIRQIVYDGRERPSQVVEQIPIFGSWYSIATATYAYDPFGGVASLVTSGSTSDTRVDHRYGGAAESSLYGSAQTPVLERRIPLPGGRLVLKRGQGSTAVFDYVHDDLNGSHFVTSATGAVTQQAIYRPYGDTRVLTGTPGSTSSWKYLFNGGDSLRDFQILQVGARLYEPRFGRFLQRDPLSDLRSASRAHPYAFAGDDPVSRTDPTGLCGDDGTGPCGLPWPADGSGGAGGAGAGVGAGRTWQAPPPRVWVGDDDDPFPVAPAEIVFDNAFRDGGLDPVTNSSEVIIIRQHAVYGWKVDPSVVDLIRYGLGQKDIIGWQTDGGGDIKDVRYLTVTDGPVLAFTGNGLYGYRDDLGGFVPVASRQYEAWKENAVAYRFYGRGKVVAEYELAGKIIGDVWMVASALTPMGEAEGFLGGAAVGHLGPEAEEAAEVVPQLGGSYGAVRAAATKAGASGEVHHMPAWAAVRDAGAPFTEYRAPSIFMKTADHVRTPSWGSGAAALQYRAVQKTLIENGRFLDALQMDIDAIRAVHGSKYDDAIQQMLNYLAF